MDSLMAIPEEELVAMYAWHSYSETKRFWVWWYIIGLFGLLMMLYMLGPWMMISATAYDTGEDFSQLVIEEEIALSPMWPLYLAFYFSGVLSTLALFAIGIQRALWRNRLGSGQLMDVIDKAIAGSSPEVDEFLEAHGLVAHYTPKDEDEELALKRELQMLIATRLDQFPNAWVHNIFYKRVGIVLLAVPVAMLLYYWTLVIARSTLRQSDLPWYYSVYCLLYTAWLARYCFKAQAGFWLTEVQLRLGYVIAPGLFLMRMAEKRNRRQWDQPQ
ncbi:MAG: hypothetical protein H7A35_01935 [Planctomycetales bacterium]|nr:hypothetical protein [bacterium]UNM08819.1 MAG: hypothetical protein H7A35_01935 [Planctomycetales bacterium]